MLRRVEMLGFAGFRFGPGINWWPVDSDRQPVAGPFITPEAFDAWLTAQEAARDQVRDGLRTIVRDVLAEGVTDPPLPLNPGEYRCAGCGKTFTGLWSDEEAQAELQAEFPGIQSASCEIVCDDCYRLMMGTAPSTPIG